MNEPASVDKPSFRVHFIRTPGRKCDLSIRVLVVETADVQAVYEGFISWTTCRRWIDRLESMGIPAEELEVVRRLLDRRKLATIQSVRASPLELEPLGLQRADQ
jgi:hypothetical protein